MSIGFGAPVSGCAAERAGGERHRRQRPIGPRVRAAKGEGPQPTATSASAWARLAVTDRVRLRPGPLQPLRVIGDRAGKNARREFRRRADHRACRSPAKSGASDRLQRLAFDAHQRNQPAAPAAAATAEQALRRHVAAHALDEIAGPRSMHAGGYAARAGPDAPALPRTVPIPASSPASVSAASSTVAGVSGAWCSDRVGVFGDQRLQGRADRRHVSVGGLLLDPLQRGEEVGIRRDAAGHAMDLVDSRRAGGLVEPDQFLVQLLPGRSPVNVIGISSSGTKPASRIRSRAMSTSFTCSPISRT